MRGRAAIGIDRAQRRQPAPRLGDSDGGRRVEPAQFGGIGDAPQRAVEQQRGEVRLEDLGRIEGRQAHRRRRLPQPIDHARCLPPGAAGALGGGGLAHTLGGEARDACRAIIARPARQSGIDDDPHPVERQAGLGDRGGEHELACASWRRAYGGALLGGIEAAVQAVERHIGGQAVEPLGGTLDLCDAGQEGEQAALCLVGERGPDRGGHRILNALGRVAAEVAQFDGVAAAGALDQRRPLADQPGEALAVERRRHRQQPEVRPKRRLRVERECEAEIAVEAALMHLVEQHGGDTGQVGIGLDTVAENAFGQHRDAGRGGSPGVEPGGVAKGLADRLTGELRHPLRRRPSGEPARREQQHLARAPCLADQRRGDRSRLAGARRRDQHRRRARPQSREQIGEDGMDGKVGHAIRINRPPRRSIGARHREVGGLDQRGLGATIGEAAQRCDRTLAVMASARERVGHRTAFVE